MSDRENRIFELESYLGTPRETPLTKKRIAEYKSISDAEYLERMEAAKSASVARMISF